MPIVRSSSKRSSLPITNFISALICAFTLAGTCIAQVAANSHGLITAAVDEAQLTILQGNTHPLARPEFDLGTAPASLPMERMLLVLKRSPEQETALRKMLDDQQDKQSPNYHKWLTPEQFGKQFGPTDSDMQTITSWLQSHGFQVGTTKGRTVLEFSGSASQVQEAFHTTIHKYVVNGEQHWANASDPMIPAALTPAVTGVLTLHNFLKRPMIQVSAQPIYAKLRADGKPEFTSSSGLHALTPDDYRTIYNIYPTLSNGINGSGTTIGVVGRSNLYNQGADVSAFRQVLGVCCSEFSIVVNGPDPGDLGGGEEAEATLDTSWSGAAAPDAGINLVVSATTATTDGVDLSEVYIIENNYTDIMTESFSGCEAQVTSSDATGISMLAEQAAAQGITYLVATGDTGSAGCDNLGETVASGPISVNILASSPYTIAVGGTMFNEGGNSSAYWGTNNSALGSALSYIPENVWNETCTTQCQQGAPPLAAGGGGSSIFFGKPNWQFGVTGIPDDGARDLPDVSLSAAAHDPYLLCLEGSCVANSQGLIFFYGVSGTSASTPSFAGIVSLIDHQMAYLNPSYQRQGQANYLLYSLAASEHSSLSQCNGSGTNVLPASNCIFNDTTVGYNSVPGESGYPQGSYATAVGYDLASGLGSVNVANLVNGWAKGVFRATTTTISVNPVTAITHGQSVNVTVSVAPSSGTGTPAGSVSLIAQTLDGVKSVDVFTLGSNGTFTGSTNKLPGGVNYQVQARYSGFSTSTPTGTFAPSISYPPATVTVQPEPSTPTETIQAFDATGNSIPLNNVPFGSFVSVGAVVQGNSGVGYPTGTVTFTDTFGPIPGGGSYALNSQGSTGNTQGIAFDTGSHALSAGYSGDISFFASNTSQPQSFTITPGFLATISYTQSSMVVSSPGGSAQSSMTVSNSTGFSGTIAMACIGLPSEASCVFSPSSITANGTAATTIVKITVTTTAPSTTIALKPRGKRVFPGQWLIGSGLLFSVGLIGGKRQHRGWVFLLLVMLMFIPACGGGHNTPLPQVNPGTPTGTYNVTVTATSGSTVSTTGFVLLVQ
jgi:hypothetical protein